MNVLHLFADFKWTGPAQPVLSLCKELKKNNINVFFACLPAASNVYPALVQKAIEAEIPLAAVSPLNQSQIIRFARDKNIQILHVHQSREHIIAAGSKFRYRKLKIVRTNYKGIPLVKRPLDAFLLMFSTDAYITFSTRSYQRDRILCANRIFHLNPAMELEKYYPAQRNAELLSKYNIAPDEFVVGTAARVQKHRRFDVLLKGFQIALKSNPNLKLLIIGRGTRLKELVIDFAKQLGIEKSVIPTGYLSDTYIDTLRCIDAFIYLVPGSDGTCRALREAMALGKSIIGANRKMIPEIIGDSGIVIEDTPENIAKAILELASSPQLCQMLSHKARQKALSSYSIQNFTRDVIKIYKLILSPYDNLQESLY